MATLGDVLARKGRQVVSIGPQASVLEATQIMNRQQIGALIVEEEGRVLGMFTERDVLRRVVAEEKSPSTTRVDDVMTTDVVCGGRETSLEEAAAVMKNRRIRHLPVCDDDGQLEGLVSIGDLNAWEADGHETTIRFLSEYIQGRV